MNTDYHQLQTFLTVVRAGSFTKAAKELFITPASVMNQINALEENTGVKLMERTTRGTRLTAAGQVYHDEVKEIVRMLDAAVQKARKAAASEREEIRIGTSILRPCGPLTDLWASIPEPKPAFHLKIIPFDDAQIEADGFLSSGESKIDCFVSPCDSNTWRERYHVLVFDTLSCRIAVPRRHTLSHKKSLTWADLDGEKLMLIRSDDTPVLSRLWKEIQEHHPKVTPVAMERFYDTESFNKCESFGYLMETMDIWKDAHPGLITLPMEWEYAIPYGVICSRNPSAAVQMFFQHIERFLSA